VALRDIVENATHIIEKSSHGLHASREHVSQAALAMMETTNYQTIVQLGGSSMALAIKAARGTLIEFSEKDRAECARLHAQERS
jgi:hypothetical protein